MERAIGPMRGLIVLDVGEVADVITRGSKGFGLTKQEQKDSEQGREKRKRPNFSHRREETIRGPCVAAVEAFDEPMPDVNFDRRWPDEVHAISG